MSERQQDPRQTSVAAPALRKRPEEQAGSIEQTTLSAHTPEEIQRILHELRVHQVKLEMQKEELRTARTQLEAGRARYFDLYDLAPVGYCTISEKGIILETNLTLTTMLGVNRLKMIEKPLSAFILSEDQDIYYLLQKESLDTGNPQTCEIRMVRSDKTIFWASVQTTALQDEDGTKSLRVTISDFSSRKMAEQKLRASEAENRVIVELVPGMIFRLGKDGQYLDIKISSEEKLAAPIEDPLKKNIKDVFPSDVASLMLDAIRKTIAANDLQVIEYELAVQEGRRIFETRIQKLTDDEVLAFVRDITKRKLADDELCTFKIISDNAIYGKAIADNDGKMVYTNRFFAEIHGYAPEELIGQPVSVLHTKKQLETVDQTIARMLQSGKFEPQEIWHVHRNGVEFPMLMSGVVIRGEQNSPQYLAVSAVDITARKQAETAVQEGEKNLKDIFELTLSGYWDWNLVDNTEYLSPTFKRMFGYEDHEMESSPETWQRIIFPEDLPRVLEVFDRHVKSHGREPFYNEIRYRHKDGSTVWVICAGRVIEWAEDGTALRMIGCHIDITDRRRAEFDLQSSLKQNQRILDNLQDAYFQADKTGNFVLINPAATEMYGYNELEELIGKPALTLYADAKERDRLIETLKEAGSVSEFITEGRRKDGSTFWASINAQFVRNEAGEIIGTEGVVRDISDRIRSTEELEQQRDVLAKRLRQTVKAISKIGELRDAYTAGHQKRVAELACAIGSEMGLAGEQIHNLSYGGLIHDIGKFFIPSDILNKPGKVSDLEYKILQTHAKESYNVVKEIDFPQKIHTMIHQHHERLDGSGYPLGLSGDEIILESRIMAVADVVEAMSSHRPYRAALGIDAALEEILLHRGTKYDEEVVDVCIKLIKEDGIHFSHRGPGDRKS